MTPAVAALLAALFCLALALFHLALALGAPLGAYAWGFAEEGPLSPRLRRGSAILSPIILAMGVALLIRGGWFDADDSRNMVVPVWAVLLFMVLQALGAIRSPSPRERRVMGPVLVIGTAVTAVAAFSGLNLAG